MRMIITESPIRARTIWSAFNDPEGTVVVPLESDFVGLKGKTPADESNGFTPIWGLTNERAFRALTRQARNAEQIILAQRDDWLVSVTEEMLRSSGITAPIIRVRFDDLHPDAIKASVNKIVPIDRDVVTRGWRRKVADRIAGDAISKVLKKTIGVDWSPTLEELRMLRTISVDNATDIGKIAQLPVQLDPSLPTIGGALVRLSTTNHPAIIAQQIIDLLDYGLLSLASQAAVGRLADWCMTNGAETYKDINAMGLLLPMDAETDLRQIQPAYRATYTNIWSYAIRQFMPSFSVDPPLKPGLYAAETARYFTHDALERALILGKLRDAGLIFGWTYAQLTETGILVDSMIQSTWPLMSNDDFLLEALKKIDDVRYPREDAIGGVKAATIIARDVELPAVVTLCPVCRGTLKPSLNQKRLRLVCQDSNCSSVWPAEQQGSALRPLIDHEAPRWCETDGVVPHSITLDLPTHATRQTCKVCSRSTTH